MTEAKRLLTEAWLKKANSDLKTAIWIKQSPETHYDTGIYHCQQCAEKAIKGFLVYHDTEFRKTHDIASLMLLAIPLESEFANWVNIGDALTRYATEFRYPDDLMIQLPTEQEFADAITDAESIYNFVLSKLPNETHP
jgi:HEPN domain-containing protein